MVDFSQSPRERAIRRSLRELTAQYDESYWRGTRDTRTIPEAFWRDLAEHDWLGVMIPEEYGGQGLGVQELVVVMEEVAAGGGWSVLPFFTTIVSLGANTLTKYGSEEQKRTWLPKIANGECQWATAITEPDAGLNTTNISTFAEKEGNSYTITGRKIFISSAGEADQMAVLTRTIPRDESDGGLDGFSMFLVDPDDPAITCETIPLEIYNPDDVYNVYIDGVTVDESRLLGTEHEGLRQLFDSINVERVTSGISAYGMGRQALEQACDYANERQVFDEPIGAHQAIQHPLADAYAELESSRVSLRKAAWMIDEDEGNTAEFANIAKLNASKAAWSAAEAAMSTFGGIGASSDLDVAKIWSKVRHYRYSPVSEEMIRNYLAEKGLGLPRSY